MPGISANKTVIPFGRSGASWTPLNIVSKLLFWGAVSEISGGQMPNKITGATDYLTVSGTPLTFQCPDTAEYIAADTDYIWFKTDETQRTTTSAELIGYDLQRTPVKYMDDDPNTLQEIIILADGAVLTESELNNLFDYMHLPIMWNGTWNDYGREKSNRSDNEQILWTPEPVGPVYDDAAVALFTRMATADGEEQTDERKAAINTAILTLKAEELFDTQFDALVCLRGKNVASTKLNWIKTTSNAEAVLNGGTLTFTSDIGYHSDGTKSKIRTNYNPASDKVLYAQNDCCFGWKVSGTVGDGSHGAISSAAQWCTHMANIGAAGYGRINQSSAVAGGVKYAVGYNCVSRASVSQHQILVNANKTDVTSTSVAFTYALELHVLGENFTTPIYCADTEVLELYWIGKALTQAKFLKLQEIFNTLFANY